MDCSQQTHAECMAEAELVIYDCVENLLHKTGVQPRQASGPMLQQWLQGPWSSLLWQNTVAQGPVTSQKGAQQCVWFRRP